MHPFIQEASIQSLFRVILIILIVYAVYSVFMRLIVPALMRKYVSDFQNQFSAESQRMRAEQEKKKEGEISITYVDDTKKATSKQDKAGEYVDYEEIK